MRKVWVALWACGCAVLPMGTAVAGPYPPPSSVSVQVNPDRVAPGECTSFSGQGFQPLATVTITESAGPNDPAPRRDPAQADLQGDFRTDVCFAQSASRGKHVLTATGSTVEGTQSASATVRVVGVAQSARGGSAAASTAGSDGTLRVLPRVDGSGTVDGSGNALTPVGLDGDAPAAGLLPPLGVLAGSGLMALLALTLLRAERRHRARRRPSVTA